MPKGKGSLPPQHGLELLTVYAWEQGGQDPQFSMAEGFRTVLELVTQYRQLCVYWTVNYSREDQTVRDFLEQQLRKPRFGPTPMAQSPGPKAAFLPAPRGHRAEAGTRFVGLSSFPALHVGRLGAAGEMPDPTLNLNFG